MQLVPCSPTTLATRIHEGKLASRHRSGSNPIAIRWDLVDFVRAFAALLVFLEHFAGLSTRFTYGNTGTEHIQFFLMHIGTMGSDCLLLLSGFFDAKSVANPKFEYFSSLRNRTFRILPTYWAVLGFAVVFGLIFPRYAKIPWNSNFLPSLLQNLIPFPGTFPSQPILTVSWMLAYIVFGYVTLPALALAVQRFLPGKRGRVTAWLLALTIGFTSLFFTSFLNVRILLIPVGCLLMEWNPAIRIAQHPRQWTLAGIFLIPMLLVVRFLLDCGYWTVGTPLEHNIALHTVSGIALALFLALVIGWESHCDISRWTRPLAPLADFGQRGYAFYLIHGPIARFGLIAITHYFDPDWTSTAVFLSAGVLCFLVANLASQWLYRTIELPIRQWRTRPDPVAQRARAATA